VSAGQTAVTKEPCLRVILQITILQIKGARGSIRESEYAQDSSRKFMTLYQLDQLSQLNNYELK